MLRDISDSSLFGRFQYGIALTGYIFSSPYWAAFVREGSLSHETRFKGVLNDLPSSASCTVFGKEIKVKTQDYVLVV